MVDSSDDDPFWKSAKYLRSESPRGWVLISCGLIEEQLKQLLLAYMIEGRAANDFVDGMNAPLGTFSSRITAAYLLGLVDDDEYHDLNLLRKIRNDFAHVMETTFQTSNVVDRCSLLRHKAQNLGGIKVDPFNQFQTTALSILVDLQNKSKLIQRTTNHFK